MSASPHGSPLSLPNALSASRLVLAAPQCWAVLGGRASLAALLFACAVASDLLDGYLARRSARTSRLGALLDHTADAVYVASLAAALAAAGYLPPVLAPLIALAFVQYLLDSKVHAGAGLRASRLGRWNGVAYFVAAGLGLAALHAGAGSQMAHGSMTFGWLLVASTLVSMAGRLAWTLSVFRRH
ncbi:MAG: CDP-alcohol phosphatidyltransferase family protein [Gammaproteobacteria bacterium]